MLMPTHIYGFMAATYITFLNVNGQDCDTGWQKYKGVCYYFSENVYTYKNAVQICTTRGGHLADAKTEDIKDYISDRSAKYWISLHQPSGNQAKKADRAERREGWVWHDGSLASYANWAKGEPEKNERCVKMNKDGKWDGKTCDGNANYRYICEKVPTATSTERTSTTTTTFLTATTSPMTTTTTSPMKTTTSTTTSPTTTTGTTKTTSSTTTTSPTATTSSTTTFPTVTSPTTRTSPTTATTFPMTTTSTKTSPTTTTSPMTTTSTTTSLITTTTETTMSTTATHTTTLTSITVPNSTSSEEIETNTDSTRLVLLVVLGVVSAACVVVAVAIAVVGTRLYRVTKKQTAIVA